MSSGIIRIHFLQRGGTICMASVSLVIPAFNEEDIINKNVKAATAFLKENFSDFEVIVVDDGSCDDTYKQLMDTEASVIRFNKNMGKGAAVREGITRAEGDFIFFTDADLPYSLEFIKDGVAILAKADVVCGRRFGSYPLGRRIISKIYNGLISIVLGICVEDVQCGIKGFSRSVAKQIFPLCKVDSFAFDTEVLFLAEQMGFSIESKEVNIFHRGNSTVNVLRDGIRMFADVIKIRKGFEAGAYEMCKGFER